MKIFKALFNGNEFYVTPGKGGDFIVLNGDIHECIELSNIKIPMDKSEFTNPIAPSKIIGVGTNYAESDSSFKKSVPLIFSVPKTAIGCTNSDINITRYFDSALIEGELGVVIKKQAKNILQEDVCNYISGYTICNDISARDSCLPVVSNLIKKGSDGFFPIGPCFLKKQEILNFNIRTYINGNLLQSGNTKDMIYSISECISFITKFVTLEQGDIVSMGTPLPKPKAYPGDNIKIEIDGIGILVNNIISV